MGDTWELEVCYGIGYELECISTDGFPIITIQELVLTSSPPSIRSSQGPRNLLLRPC